MVKTFDCVRLPNLHVIAPYVNIYFNPAQQDSDLFKQDIIGQSGNGSTSVQKRRTLLFSNLLHCYRYTTQESAIAIQTGMGQSLQDNKG